MAKVVRMDDASVQEDFLTRLTLKDWRRIGRGKFGFAYGKGNLVWKVESGSVLSGWTDYIVAVAEGYFKGPHVPKVKLVLIFRDGVAALMERLVRSVAESYLDQRQYAITSMIERTSEYRYNGQYRESCSWSWMREQFRGLPLTLWNFGRQICKWVSDNGYWLDAHGNNVMLRRDGTLVVIDPVSDRDGETIWSKNPSL